MDQAALDYLGRLAGLGMSFVGFATIVVTLRRTLGGEFTPFDHLLVRYYIESGLLTTVGALVPSLLNLFAIPPTVMWRIVSALAGILGPIYLELYFHWRRRITQGQLYGRGIRIAVSVASSSACG